MSLDFKAEHEPNIAEHAKDIAAFANVFGGTILVGVAEKSDSFTRKVLPVETARRASRDYEDAARELLTPRPTIETVVVSSPEPGMAIVAVNVDPYPGQLVGARLPNTQSWRFPIRTAARHSIYVDPEKFMIYSDPRTRKAAILLAAAGPGPNCSVTVQVMERREYDEWSNTEVLLDGTFTELDIENNSASFSLYVSDRSQIVPFKVPLEDVEAVWKASPFWSMRLDGALRFYPGHDGRQLVRYMSGRGPFNWG